ncbi:serine/threonine protein kinase [Myxococcota bacterium]|nr:serine/threonine protein kinase [Myxococcota bacterium]
MSNHPESTLEPLLPDATTVPGDPMLGRVLGGKFVVQRMLGAGGMGAVYVGVQHPVGREVAVKVIPPAPGGRTGAAADLEMRFLREARALATLDHAGIVTLHDSGVEPDGTLYLVMEFLRGETLKERIVRRGAMPVPVALATMLQILSAVAHAHARGLIHRDLKPENMILAHGGRGGAERVKVLDFGIAKIQAESGNADLGQTRAGIVLGTPRYMAPEQIHSAPVTAATDVYSLGVLLFEMLAGHPPFDAPSTFALLSMHAREPVPPLPAHVPEPVWHVVARAMAKEPVHRFADAAEMARHLEPLAAAMPAPPVPTAAEPEEDDGIKPTVEMSTTSMLAGEALRASPRGGSAAGSDATSRSGRIRRVLLGAAGVAALAAGALWGLLRDVEPPAPPVDTTPAVMQVAIAAAPESKAAPAPVTQAPAPEALQGIIDALDAKRLEMAAARAEVLLTSGSDAPAFRARVRTEPRFDALRRHPRVARILAENTP